MGFASSKSAVAALFAVLLVAGQAGGAETLRIGGTGAAAGMLRQVGAEFTLASGISIDVVSSLGSTGAIRALTDGKLDVAVSARPLNADEVAAGLRQVALLRTAFVLATSHQNQNGLKAADLPKILSEQTPVWGDGTPIRIILRPRSETDTTLLGEMFAGLDKAIEALRQRPEVPIAATDQDNVSLAERMPGSLTGTTLAQLKTEHPNLRVVPIDNVKPTLASFESGAYPFAKNLYFAVRANEAPGSRRFFEFLRSPQGIKALRDADTLPGAE
jgi:phosphate transport system substrate-binding protein